MLLSEVIADLAVTGGEGDRDVEVTRVELDSRLVEPGTLFCCVSGRDHDGHDFAPEAVDHGAVALLVERRLDIAEVPQIVVADARRATALAAAAVCGQPSRDLDVVGVTGTNGKTTTTHLLALALDEAGRRVEVLGTLSGARTTPEAPELQRQLAAWRDVGVDAVAMEVSSHALALNRVDGTRFSVAVFTNLSRDHLDFHGTTEAYFEAKARLFRPELSDLAVVNLDSSHGRLLRDAAEIPTVGYSLEQAESLRLDRDGCRFVWRGHPVHLHLVGELNVSNALAAAEAAVALGLDPVAVARGLSRPAVVPGRFELVDAGQPYLVVVDYAHTPDGLDRVLQAADGLAGSGKVAVVFGCGGDRDSSKRPFMGEVAARRADRVVLTADNSRGEPTGAIIDAVKQGFDRIVAPRATSLTVEPDRRAAIASALDHAEPGDVVVIAGKGHERTQTIDDSVVEFDDRVVARAELARRGFDQRAAS